MTAPLTPEREQEIREGRTAFYRTRDHLDAAVDDLLAELDRLRALAAVANEYVIRDSNGRVVLAVRHAPGRRDGWCVIEGRLDGGRRRAWTRDGWRWLGLLTDSDTFCWPDAATAVAEARSLATVSFETEVAR